MNKILPIPAFKDNYIWAIINEHRNTMAVVDPGDAKPVMIFAQENELTLTDILITHHHWDHTGGLPTLLKSFENITVYGPESIKGVSVGVHEGDKIKLNNYGLSFNVLEVPGHTLDHIAYYNSDCLFCGDTLFSVGCGRIFEGTPSTMLASLNKLKALPDKTKVYCAHEYTLSNLAFARHLEPNNTEILNYAHKCEALRQQSLPTLPSTIGLEKSINPFLRCDTETVLARAAALSQQKPNSELDTFAIIRQMKDSF